MDCDLVDQSTDRGFLHFWGSEDVERCVLEGGAVMVCRGGVCVVSVPAEAIACVDAALFFHIRQIP